MTETAIPGTLAAGEPAAGLPALDFTVQGMTCGSCAARVQKVLGRQPGVETAEVNFASGIAHVVPGPGGADQDALIEAIAKINYGLMPLSAPGAGEDDSEHPVGRAIAKAAAGQAGELPPAEGFQAIAGHGVRAGIGGETVWGGTRKLMAEAGLALPLELAEAATRLESEGKTAVFAGWDGQVRGVLAVADTLKDGAAGTVAGLHARGLKTAMITGDNARTAHAIAARTGIDVVLAEVLPAGKQAEIRRLQEAGEVVAMVGDGVNDAPALVQADLGIAIGTGTDVAIQASDLTLMSGDLAGVATAIGLSRRTYRTILQNLFWAFGYNTAAIPLAAFGLLSPVIAGAAMGFSSVSVVANSLRLLRFRGDSLPMRHGNEFGLPGTRVLLLDPVAVVGLKALDLITVPLQGEHFTRRPLRHVQAQGLQIEQHDRFRLGITERLAARKPAARPAHSSG